MPELDLAAAQRVHLVGIGGSGMAALASLLLDMGKTVSGSDAAPSAAAERLAARGARVFVGHAAEHVGDAEYLVRSSAVALENPEVQCASRAGIPTRKLAEAVGELMRGRQAVGVAGTHGKTTTTALVSWLLERAGLDPLALIGADTPSFPNGARAGDGPMVVEADEYDRRFLAYWPAVAVVTSVEADHLDYFADLDEIRGTFQALVDRLPEDGLLVVCADDACAVSLHSRARKETYGFAESADWRISAYATRKSGSAFTLSFAGRSWTIESPLFGEHNARNATAAIAVADYFGVGLRAAVSALPDFQGPRRRFESKGEARGIRVMDDYAHHPTEVTAVLRTARSVAAGEVWAIFQPHTSNRTANLLEDFGRSFGDAQHVLVLPIYKPSGREVAARDVSAEDVVRCIGAAGHPDARSVESFERTLEIVAAEAHPGDLVVTLGAGDVTRLSDELLETLGR